jgi:hypothetical protein
MSADTLLSRLDRVRRVAPGRWFASCPGPLHKRGDRTPSLNVTELPDGKILMICRVGCSNEEILTAAGFSDWSVLFPETLPDPRKPSKPERRPFIPAQVFDIARLEIGVIAIIAGMCTATAP